VNDLLIQGESEGGDGVGVREGEGGAAIEGTTMEEGE
jgi:hypothetical protein